MIPIDILFLPKTYINDYKSLNISIIIIFGSIIELELLLRVIDVEIYVVGRDMGVNYGRNGKESPEVKEMEEGGVVASLVKLKIES